MYSDKSPLDGSDATHLGVWLGEKRPEKQSSEKQRANQCSVNAVARRFVCVNECIWVPWVPGWVRFYREGSEMKLLNISAQGPMTSEQEHGERRASFQHKQFWGWSAVDDETKD